jgi:hypothetical protein
MSGAIPSFPQYVFMAWCLVKHRDNFTFTLPYLRIRKLSVLLVLYRNPLYVLVKTMDSGVHVWEKWKQREGREKRREAKKMMRKRKEETRKK